MKKKKIMKTLWLSLLVCGILLATCSCTARQASVSAGASSATPSSTATATPSPQPSTPPVSQAPALAAVVPSQTTNLVTGEETLSAAAYGKRPVAVSVNNISASWPQYGISAADMIFEIPVESSITRMMAIYGDYTQIPSVCSIRSCRYYFPMFAQSMDAVFVHCGIDAEHAKPMLAQMGIETYDAAYDQLGLFARDQSRLNSGYAYEHTLSFLGGKYAQAMENSGYRTDLGQEYKRTVFSFANQEILPQGDDCTAVRVTFGADYFSDLTYNAQEKVYYKDHSGTPHMDAVTGEQLHFDNVLILETDIHIFAGDTAGRKEVNVLANNYSGYYISMGKVQKILWSKASAFAPLVFTDTAGQELLMNSGKTYVAVCTPGDTSF